MAEEWFEKRKEAGHGLSGPSRLSRALLNANNVACTGPCTRSTWYYRDRLLLRNISIVRVDVTHARQSMRIFSRRSAFSFRSRYAWSSWLYDLSYSTYIHPARWVWLLLSTASTTFPFGLGPEVLMVSAESSS
jgi:hypothetical protein